MVFIALPNMELTDHNLRGHELVLPICEEENKNCKLREVHILCVENPMINETWKKVIYQKHKDVCRLIYQLKIRTSNIFFLRKSASFMKYGRPTEKLHTKFYNVQCK